MKDATESQSFADFKNRVLLDCMLESNMWEADAAREEIGTLEWKSQQAGRGKVEEQLLSARKKLERLTKGRRVMEHVSQKRERDRAGQEKADLQFQLQGARQRQREAKREIKCLQGALAADISTDDESSPLPQ